MSRDRKEKSRYVPLYRDFIIDSSRTAHVKSAVSAHLEIDITLPRKLIGEMRGCRGSGISFFPFLVASIGRAVAQEPSVQTYRDLFGRPVIFKSADILVPIEREGVTGGLPLLYIIREAERKPLLQIHREIVGAGSAGLQEVWGERRRLRLKLFFLLPRPFRIPFYFIVRRLPNLFVKSMGSIAVTPVGLLGRPPDRVFNPSIYTTSIIVGGIGQRGMMSGQKLSDPDVLHITVAMNRDMVEGETCSRFAQRLTKLIESAELLKEFIEGPDFPDPAMIETKTLLKD